MYWQHNNPWFARKLYSVFQLFYNLVDEIISYIEHTEYATLTAPVMFCPLTEILPTLGGTKCSLRMALLLGRSPTWQTYGLFGN